MWEEQQQPGEVHRQFWQYAWYGNFFFRPVPRPDFLSSVCAGGSPMEAEDITEEMVKAVAGYR